MVSEVCLTSTSVPVSNWIIDSAATVSLTPFKKDFSFGSFKGGNYGTVKVANGGMELLKGRGKVELKAIERNTGRIVETSFTAYYAPSLARRLFSVGQGMDEKFGSSFRLDLMCIHHPSGAQLKVDRVGDLFVLRTAGENEANMLETSTAKMLQHAREGHAHVLKGDEFCEACILGKMTRKHHSHKPKRPAGKVNETVHTDTTGKIAPSSRGGMQYCQVFIDSCSRYRSVKFMKKRDDVLSRNSLIHSRTKE